MATATLAPSMEISTGTDADVSSRLSGARLTVGLAKAGAPCAPLHALAVVAALISAQGALVSARPDRGLSSHVLIAAGMGNNNGNGNVGTGNGNGNSGNNNGNNNVGNGNGNNNSGNNNGNENVGNNDGNGNSGNNNGNRNMGSGLGNGHATDNNGNGMLLHKN